MWENLTKDPNVKNKRVKCFLKFERVLKVSKNKWKGKKSFDGKKFWQPIKKILGESNYKASGWKKNNSYRKVIKPNKEEIEVHKNYLKSQLNKNFF